VLIVVFITTSTLYNNYTQWHRVNIITIAIERLRQFAWPVAGVNMLNATSLH